MSKIGFDDARGNCHWLALSASLIIAAGTIIATMFWPDASDASVVPNETNPLEVVGDYPNPEHCRDCHPKEYEAWSGTSHAGAVFDPIFQVDLQKSDQPGECYACHTTGYDSETGQFALAGVTCEACHGPYQQGHSAQNVKVVFSGDLCGKCHTDILDQWLTSRHGQENMDCTVCHEVHSQKTPAADETNSVCSSCHLDQIQSTLHTTHNASGIYCLECHQGLADSVGVPPRGKADFVHVFSNFVRECDDCHPARSEPDL